MLGYADPRYAASLSEWGSPESLAVSRGSMLARHIPGTDETDAMGCYPLFSCGNWSGLQADFEARRATWVSASIVTDPLGDFNELLLRSTFDLVLPFKEHFVADLSMPLEKLVSDHHRKFARRGLRNVVVEVNNASELFLDEWDALYSHLSERHGITGLRRFSRQSFAQQLCIAGMVVMRARVGNETVGMELWLMQGSGVFNHLSAYDRNGYNLGAPYALHWTAYEYFRTRARWAVLGGGAGSTGANAGLTEHKRGWASETRQVYFCGKVLQPERYVELSARFNRTATSYFPAYRAGEF